MCVRSSCFYIKLNISFIYKEIFTNFAGNVYGYENLSVCVGGGGGGGGGGVKDSNPWEPFTSLGGILCIVLNLSWPGMWSVSTECLNAYFVCQGYIHYVRCVFSSYCKIHVPSYGKNTVKKFFMIFISR